MATWVITGAASGLGRELAKQLASKGERLVLWDRDERGLTELAALLSDRVALQQTVDVADERSVRDAANTVAERVESVDHLIHAAGVLRVGDALSMSSQDYRLMLDINVLGTIHVATMLVPLLERSASRKKPGKMALISSIAGLRAVPTLAGYSASKYAVVGFARALADELHDHHIDVKIVCPPAVDTPMVRNLPELPAVYRLSPPQPVEKVARALLQGLNQRGFLVLLDTPSKVLWRINKFAPGVVDRALLWAQQR